MRRFAALAGAFALSWMAPAAADVTVSPREIRAYQAPAASGPRAPSVDCPPSLCSAVIRQPAPAQPSRPSMATQATQAQGYATQPRQASGGTAAAPGMSAVLPAQIYATQPRQASGGAASGPAMGTVVQTPPSGWAYVATPPSCAGSTCVRQPPQLVLQGGPQMASSVAASSASGSTQIGTATASGTTQIGTVSSAPAASGGAKTASAPPAETQTAASAPASGAPAAATASEPATAAASSSSSGGDAYADKKKADEEAARRAQRELEERMRHEGAKRIREESAARARSKLGYADVETVERADGVVIASTPPPSSQTIQNIAAAVSRGQGEGGKKGDGCDFEGLCGKAAEKAAKEAQDALNKAREEARRLARERAEKAKKELKEKKEKLKQAERERRRSAARQLEDQQREKAERLSKEAKDLEKRGKEMGDKQKALEEDERRLRREEGDIRKNDPNCQSAACRSKQAERAANSKATTDLARESGKFQAESARFQGQLQEFNRSQDRLDKMKDAGEGMSRDEHRAHMADKRNAEAHKNASDIEKKIEDLKAKQQEIREKGESGSRQDKALDKEIEAGGRALDKARAAALEAQNDSLKAKATSLGLKDEYDAYQRGRNALDANQSMRNAGERLNNIEKEEARLRKEGAKPEALKDIEKLRDQAKKDLDAAKKVDELARKALGTEGGKPRNAVGDVNKFVEQFSTAQQIDNMTGTQMRDQIAVHEAAEKRIDQALGGVGGKIPPASGPVYDSLKGLEKEQQALEKKLADMDKSMADAFKRGSVPASAGAAFAEARKETLEKLDEVKGKIGGYGALGAADAVTADVLEINKALGRLTAGLPLDKAGNVDKDALAKQVVVAGQAQMELSRAHGELAGLDAKRAGGGKLSAAEEEKASKLRGQVQDLTKQLKGLGVDVKIEGEKVQVTAESLAGAVTWNAAREAVTEMTNAINETKKKVASLRNEPPPGGLMSDTPRAAPAPGRAQAGDATAPGVPTASGAPAPGGTQARDGVPPVRTVEPPPGPPGPGTDLNAAGGRVAKVTAGLGGAAAVAGGAASGAGVGAGVGGVVGSVFGRGQAASGGQTQERAPEPVKEVKPEPPPAPPTPPAGAGTQVASVPPTKTPEAPVKPEDLTKLRNDAEAARKRAQDLEREALQAERDAKRAKDEADRARREAEEKKRVAQQQAATTERLAAGYGELAVRTEADVKKYEDQAKALREKAAEMKKAAERYDRAAGLAKDKALADAARQAAANAREDAAKEERRAAESQKVADDWRARGGQHRDSAQSVRGGGEKLKAEAQRAEAEAQRKEADAARFLAEAQQKFAAVASLGAEAENKRAELARIQSENIQRILNNPPSKSFYSDMSMDQRTQWLRDNVPEWDNLPTDKKLHVLRTISAVESRAQAVAAGEAFDQFIKDRKLTEGDIKQRAGHIDTLRKELEAKKNEWFISQDDNRRINWLEGQIKRETGNLNRDLRMASEMRDDVLEKSRVATRDYFQVDEEARNKEALKRIDQLAQAKGELRVAQEASRVREQGFEERMNGIRQQRADAVRAGDTAAVAKADTALKQLETARAEWRNYDQARIRGQQAVVAERRDTLAREASDVGLYAITNRDELDKMADARLLQNGVPATRLNGELSVARDSVGAIGLEPEKRGFWGNVVDAYDSTKTTVAAQAGTAVGAVKGVGKALGGMLKLFVWEPIDAVGENAEIAMDIVFGARTNVFGTDNQEFVMGAVNDPGKTMKTIYLGLGKEVYDFTKNVEKVGKAYQERDAAGAYAASRDVSTFLAENLFDPSMIAGGIGKLAQVGRVAGQVADVARVAGQVADAGKIAGQAGDVARAADTAIAAAGKLDAPVAKLEGLGARGAGALDNPAAGVGPRAVPQGPSVSVPGTGNTTIRLPPGEAAGLTTPTVKLPPAEAAGLNAPTVRMPPGQASGAATPTVRLPPAEAAGLKSPTVHLPPAEAAGLKAPTVRLPPADAAGLNAPTVRMPPGEVAVGLASPPGRRAPGAPVADTPTARFDQPNFDPLKASGEFKAPGAGGAAAPGTPTVRFDQPNFGPVRETRPFRHPGTPAATPQSPTVKFDQPNFDPLRSSGEFRAPAADPLATVPPSYATPPKAPRAGSAPAAQPTPRAPPPPDVFVPAGAQARAPPAAGDASGLGKAGAASPVDRGAPTVTGTRTPSGSATVPPPVAPRPGVVPDAPAPRINDPNALTKSGPAAPAPAGAAAPAGAPRPVQPTPGRDGVSVGKAGDGSLIVRRAADGAEIKLPKDAYLGEGTFSNAYRSPNDPNAVVKLTKGGDRASALDDLGRAAVESVGNPNVIQTPKLLARLDIVESAMVPARRGGMDAKNFAGGTMSVVERAPPAFRDAPAVVNLPDGTSYRFKTETGQMTPGQRVAYDNGIRALNEKGFAWLDNKSDNFTFVRNGPPGSDKWTLVPVDTGGMVPMKGLDAAERAANARALQRAVDAPADEVRKIYGGAYGPQYHKGSLAQAFDGLVDFERINRDTGLKLDTLGGGKTSVPFNPRNGIDHPEIGKLAEATTPAQTEAARAAAFTEPTPRLGPGAVGYKAGATPDPRAALSSAAPALPPPAAVPPAPARLPDPLAPSVAGKAPEPFVPAAPPPKGAMAPGSPSAPGKFAGADDLTKPGMPAGFLDAPGAPRSPPGPPPPAGSVAPPSPNAPGVVVGADGAGGLVLRRAADGNQLHLPANALAGEGSFSKAYRVPGSQRAPNDPGLVAKLTKPGDAAGGLDDLGRSAVEAVGNPNVIQTPKLLQRYNVIDSPTVMAAAKNLGDKNFKGGTLSILEAAPPSFKDAPASITAPDGTPYRVKTDGGKMTPGQTIAYDRGVRALNEKGFAWLDNKSDNFTFRRAGPPGSDEWTLVVVDTGGIVPMVDRNPAKARALQQMVDNPPADILKKYQGVLGRDLHMEFLGKNFDAHVDWKTIERHTGREFQSLGRDEVDLSRRVPYNPYNATVHPEISPLAAANTAAEIEAARKAARAALPPPELRAPPPPAPPRMAAPPPPPRGAAPPPA